MTRATRAVTLVWALLSLSCAVLVARATYTADLSAFLPRAPSAAQRLLVEQLRSGPVVHLVLLGIEGADAPSRAQLSMRLAASLRQDPAFSAVGNGDFTQLARDREIIFRHRYQLSPQMTPARFTVSGLQAAIAEALDTLASPEGLLLKPLFPHDPSGETLAVIDAFAAGQPPHSSAGVWSSADGERALLTVQLRASGSDTDAQQAACEKIRHDFAAALAALGPHSAPGARLLMTGPPVQAVAARDTIRREVVRLSLLSTLLIAVLLLVVYRSMPALLLTLVPMASGALAGVAAVALGFGYVHGITLGFGVTLIGEAVDYSIYLFIQQSHDFPRSVWPTIRLGVLTSICGFAALLPSAFTGLAQLGLYSIAGLIAAALVTRFVLPTWLAGLDGVADLSAAGEALLRGLRWLHAARALLVAVPLVALLILYAHRGALFNRALSSLSPTPLAYQRLDDQLRAEAGAAESGYVVVVHGADREAALAEATALEARLSPLVETGIIGSFASPARYLPPLALQDERQQSLPPPAELRARLQAALGPLPVGLATLEPFLADAATARSAPPLTAAELGGSSLGAAVDALLVENEQGWSALLPVQAAQGAELSAAALQRLRAALSGPQSHASLLDFQGEADRLYASYLASAVRLSLVGFAAIIVLLLVALRDPWRVARVVLPLALAVMTVAALLVVAQRPLTILHIVGMLLIVAVGSNYALFFDRRSAAPEEGSLPRTLASLLTANLATVLAFGVLAFSSVPVLSDLGSTVAPGAFLALLFAALLSPATAPHARPAGS